jgi:uncharacterized protein YbjT (DUF2867 family)
MNVLVVGANGKTGRNLVKLLAGMEEHSVKAMVRNPEQIEQMRAIGGNPVLADLEKNLDHALSEVDAVIFAAGSGSKTGPDKTIAVDRNGAISLIDTALRYGITRFVMLSSMGAEYPQQGVKEMQHYFYAKHDADEHLKGSGLEYVIVRPGLLTDEKPTGKIIAQNKLEMRGSITRGDVAQVLIDSLTMDTLKNTTFEILNGNIPIKEALKNL